MAIIICPECGAEISSRAEKCVKCGLPMRNIVKCEDCGTVGFITDKLCLKCGCPFDEVEEIKEEQERYSDVVAFIEKCREQFNSNAFEDFDIDREAIILDAFAKVISQMDPRNNFAHYFISGGGEPIQKNDERNAREVFNIPKNVRVYFAASANVFGGIKVGGKGFAITPDGIYFTDDKKNRGLIDIDDFMDADLNIHNYLCIGSHEFNTTNKKVIFSMLTNLQTELKKALR